MRCIKFIEMLKNKYMPHITNRLISKSVIELITYNLITQ